MRGSESSHPARSAPHSHQSASDSIDAMQHVFDRQNRVTTTTNRSTTATCAPVRSAQVLLYQDAWCDCDDFSGFFSDLSDALNDARKFIYIAGWALSPQIRLKRGNDGEESLGDLLVRKGEAGVKVCLLIWSMPVVDKAETKYAEAYHFFNDRRNVKCVIAQNANIKLSDLAELSRTHHQKFIVIDGVVGFVGGLDLFYGRWDGPSHRLFLSPEDGSTRLWESDHYNGERDALGENGNLWPRQPWHDVHSCCFGDVVADLQEVFVRRFCHNAPYREKYTYKEAADSLAEESYVGASLRAKTWSARMQVLESGGGRSDIQTAYIASISRARSIIYIENQYFISGDGNHVPRVLGERAAHLIDDGHFDFFFMVVLPLYPEGSIDPATQRGRALNSLMFFQMQSVCLVLKLIEDALRRKGRHDDPQNFCSFFCLGKREPHATVEVCNNGKAALLCRSKRYMIYVHSKFMISDDKEFIVGSANINERSMSGTMDSEIALKCISDDETKVKSFRCTLLTEHAGDDPRQWMQRSPMEVRDILRERARRNWAAFSGPELHELPDEHILPFPITKDENGEYVMLPIPDCAPLVLKESTFTFIDKIVK